MSNPKLHTRLPIYNLDLVCEKREPKPVIMSFQFMDLDTGEILCNQKVEQRLILNGGSTGEKKILDIVASALRGFASGRSIGFEILLCHPNNNTTFQGCF